MSWTMDGEYVREAFVVTNAPDAYDYSTATTVASGGKGFRVVEIKGADVDYLAKYQADRFMSGWYVGEVVNHLASALSEMARREAIAR